MMHTPQPHDLIHVRAERTWFHFEHDADTAFAHLRACPLVVVRRAEMRESLIPIGVRGTSRSQRHAGWMHPDAIIKIEQPSDLLFRQSNSQLPAFQALHELSLRWHDLNLPWGPTGSVGFELASGVVSVNATSDLDLQIRADQPFPKAYAERLLHATCKLHAPVDVLVEIPFGGFALAEYATQATCLLRTRTGPALVSNPWLHRREAA